MAWPSPRARTRSSGSDAAAAFSPNDATSGSTADAPSNGCSERYANGAGASPARLTSRTNAQANAPTLPLKAPIGSGKGASTAANSTGRSLAATCAAASSNPAANEASSAHTVVDGAVTRAARLQYPAGALKTEL